MTLQADYAAQMLGLNTDHMPPNATYTTSQDEPNAKRPRSGDGPSPVRQTQVIQLQCSIARKIIGAF